MSEPRALAFGSGAEDGTYASELPRTDLLLTGSSGQELIDAVAQWAWRRFQATAAQLWVTDARGFHLLAAHGRAADDEDRRLARRVAIAQQSAIEGRRLLLPIAQAGERVAVLLVDLPSPESARSAIVQAAELLHHRLPAALELDRLNLAAAQLAEAERLQTALFTIAELVASDRDTAEVLAVVHRIVAGLTYAENFYIALLEQERLRFLYFSDDRDPNPPSPDIAFDLASLKGSLTAHVIATGETLMGPSEALCLQIGAEPDAYGPQSVDWLGVPLVYSGEVFGALVVQSYDPRFRYGDKDRALLTFVAQHLATALQRKRVHDELERRVAERTDELREANRALRAEIEERQRSEQLQTALFRIAELGSAGGSLEEFYAAIHRIVGRLLYADNFYIAMLSADGSELSFPYSVDQFDGPRQPRRLGRGLTEYVLRSGQAVLADRATHEALQAAGEIVAHGARSTAWLGVPLVCESGTVGVLAVQSYDDAHSYTRREQEILTFVSFHIANALERKRAAERLLQVNLELERRVAERTEALFAANRDLRQQIAERERFERQLQYAATHDMLTALPNRAHFLQRLAEALSRYHRRHRDRFGVLFLDLDRFKVINDSVGHLVGDELLKVVAQRLAKVVGGLGIVARLGGDEFAVLLEPLARDDEAVHLAEQIIASLDEPIRVCGKELFTSTSVGIAVSRPAYASPEDLLRDADVALYRAKSRGRRCCELFDEELRRAALHQLELEGNLRRALFRSEFEPVFQPIMTLDDGATVGYEALMRWRHPQRDRLVGPTEFLSVAEDSGLAEAMDWQIYELVFAQARRLAELGRYVSINVGGRHFRNANFVTDLLRVLERHAFAPECLRIEVTERVLLEDPEQVLRMMQTLRSAGIRLALDDFGTGYSSLSYLHQFPLHALKVDRSFVTALDSTAPGNAEAVLRAICTLGRSLGMDVIAEGIETERQLERVRLLGCGYGQGFLLARPQPLAALLPG